MRMEVFLTITFFALLFGHCNGESSKEYVGIGDTIVLLCHVNVTTITRRWRKDDSFVADKSDINNRVPGAKRLKITGNTELFYNLEISNVTGADAGEYWCELQTILGFLRTKITLVPFGGSLKEAMAYSTAEMEDTINREEQSSTSLDTTSESEDSIYILKQASDSPVTGSLIRKFSTNGIITIGIALMFCSLVGCMMFLILKTKSKGQSPPRAMKKERNVFIREVEIEQLSEHSNINPIYDTINETEMLRYQITSPPTKPQNTTCWTRQYEPDSSSYLDVIDDCHNTGNTTESQAIREDTLLSSLSDEGYLRMECNKNKERHEQTELKAVEDANLESLPSLQVVAYSTPRPRPFLHAYGQLNADITSTPMTPTNSNNNIKHIRNHNSPFIENEIPHLSSQPTKREDNGYLNSYVPLNKNEMEYLHCYCMPITNEDKKGPSNNNTRSEKIDSHSATYIINSK